MPTLTHDAAAQLATLLGPENVRPESTHLIVSPADTAQVASTLALADHLSLPVSPVGANTKPWGHPIAPSILLNTSRLDKVLEHTWQDMTATVQAGCPWSFLQHTLAQHGQFVALDPLWPDRATVGGIASTNDSGALRLRYGSLRDLILGMTLALPDGTIAKTGGKVVKNVAGYDLHKLMTGAHGTLAVITEVTFRLHSLAPNLQTLTIASTTPEPLNALLLLILGSHLSTHALQLRANPQGFHLDLELATIPEVIATQTHQLASLASIHHLAPEPSGPEVWQARQQLADQPGILLKATALPSGIAAFASSIHAVGGSSVTQATGIGLATLPEAASAAIPALRHAVTAAGGSLTVLRGPATLDPWGPNPPTLPLMRAIKHQFDPNRILNPGRFLGGI